IESAVANYRWKNVRIVMAVVSELDHDHIERFLASETDGCTFPVEVRVYQLNQLRKEFGISN
ncbi:MAG: hypothetical protein Q9M30_04040, partial [Mariprofundaceae bacterium]|nr:hypothetical protein [Mariprofundaceae bacterium]